jgi:hypothetical protein
MDLRRLPQVRKGKGFHHIRPAVVLLCSGLFAIAASLLFSYVAHSATLTIVNLDAAGEGFNDTSGPDSASTAGGNSGATLGAQRLIAFQYAADIWGALLSTPVEIRVEANFDSLDCDESSAVLAQSGPNTAHGNFPGAQVQNTWYIQALANSLAAMDLAPDQDDMGATFNSSLGTSCSFPAAWYYGLDGNAPDEMIDFVTVVLHELAHGLGFLSLVDLETGAKLLGFNDVFMRKLENHSTGLRYPAMTNSQRVSASRRTGTLHWVGAEVIAASGILTDGVHPTRHVEMYAPNPQEPGASVSHFSDDLAPTELLEPFYNGINHDVGLALELLADIGWHLATPEAVTDLAAATSTSTSIDLSWTAPGNDGSSGTAASYDIRYAGRRVRIRKWSVANAADGEPTPLEAGTPQSFTVSGLGCGRIYFFALRTISQAGEFSKMSNIAQGRTMACPALTLTRSRSPTAQQ